MCKTLLSAISLHKHRSWLYYKVEYFNSEQHGGSNEKNNAFLFLYSTLHVVNFLRWTWNRPLWRIYRSWSLSRYCPYSGSSRRSRCRRLYFWKCFSSRQVLRSSQGIYPVCIPCSCSASRAERLYLQVTAEVVGKIPFYQYSHLWHPSCKNLFFCKNRFLPLCSHFSFYRPLSLTWMKKVFF